MKSNQKLFFALILLVILVLSYIISYRLSPNNEFFCKITNGRWVENEIIYDVNDLSVVDSNGCHNKSDIISDIR
jgi:hypothetical protein